MLLLTEDYLYDRIKVCKTKDMYTYSTD